MKVGDIVETIITVWKPKKKDRRQSNKEYWMKISEGSVGIVTKISKDRKVTGHTYVDVYVEFNGEQVKLGNYHKGYFSVIQGQ